MRREKSRSIGRAKRLALATLLAGTSPLYVLNANEVATEQPGSDEERPQDIIVIGQSLFRDVIPESELDEDGIASYGASTVDELLSEIQGELGEEEQPLILVNGERLGDMDEIGAFPVEALRNVQVLPRGSAVRAGGTSGQRVISLTLQQKLRSATAVAANKVATEGDWHAGRGEALLTFIQGSTRGNLGLRARDESSLFESERGIIQPEPRLPFALEGNVVGFPNTSGEIDPMLSALAGEIVTVSPVPDIADPALAAFVPFANQPNSTDLGPFRTLRPKVRNYDLNGTVSTRLAPWLTANATVRLNRNISRASRGLPPALFVLSPNNAFSPFSNDVGLAFYGATPLRSRSERTGGEGRITLNGRLGRWTSYLNARHAQSEDIFDTQRQTSSGPILLADDVDPFGSDLLDLIGIRTDRSTSRSVTDQAQLAFTGPVLALPAGDAQATIEGILAWARLRSHSEFSATAGTRSFRRNEQSIRGAIDIPLTGRASGFGGAIGDLNATAEYARLHYSDAGSLDRYAFGLTWEPIERLRLRGAFEGSDTPASMQLLGAPTVETPDVRVFDPLTGETVDVLQITGGNPLLRPEETRVYRLSGLARLVPRLNLQLNSEYTDTDQRNFISSLPPTSLAVMLAFPDRYIRSSDGTLTIIDLRPVNFESHREKRLRWGLSVRTKLHEGNILGSRAVETIEPEMDAGDDAEGPPQSVARRGSPSTYLQLTANHSLVLTEKIVIRPGLDPVDLLEGGAIGIASGRVRHQVDGSAAITSGGIGARMGVAWRGKSLLESRSGGTTTEMLRFSPVMVVNLRAFADMRRVLPNTRWARGLRLSVDVANLFNDRQSVRDPFGNTPLQYQPGYRDPIGRTIEFELRKVF